MATGFTPMATPCWQSGDEKGFEDGIGGSVPAKARSPEAWSQSSAELAFAAGKCAPRAIRLANTAAP